MGGKIMDMNFYEVLLQLNVNDVLFILMQLALLFCVSYSFFVRRFKPKIQQSLTGLKMKVAKQKQQLLSSLKSTKARLINRLRRKSGHHQLIVADSVMSMSMTGNARITVNRGEASWEYFGLGWAVLSVFIIEVNSLYNSPMINDFSILILVADLVAITYLCFVSSWFRNKIIWIVNLRNKTPD
jgi:hypothetical protein